MALIAAGAAFVGLVAGGGISALTSWLTGGSHDTIQKGAQVVENITSKVIIDENGVANVFTKQVVKDSSTNLLKLPETLPWEADVVLAICFGGMAIHLLGALWGFLCGRCHALLAHRHELVRKDFEHKDELLEETKKRAAAEEERSKHLDKLQHLKDIIKTFGHHHHQHQEEEDVETIPKRRVTSWVEREREPKALTYKKKTLEDFLNTTPDE